MKKSLDPTEHPPVRNIHEKRHRRDLYHILLAVSLLCLIMLLVLAGLFLFSPRLYVQSESQTLWVPTLVILSGCLLLMLLNRRGSNLLAAVLFTLVFLAGVAVGDTPEQIFHGRSFIYFVIPLIAAGLLIRPWAGYVIVAIIMLGAFFVTTFSAVTFSDLHTLMASLFTAVSFPDLPGLMALLFIAFVVHQTSAGLERALEKEELDKRQLVESEERFRKIFFTSPHPRCIISTTGELVDCNPAFLKLTGNASVEQVRGRSGLEYVDSQWHTIVATSLETVITHGTVQDLEVKLKTDDNRTVIVALSATLLTDWQGKPSGVVCILQEITARKRMETALRASEERYRRLVDTLPIGVGVHQNGRIQLLNPTAVQMLGGEDQAQFVGQPFLDLAHPDDRQKIIDRIRTSQQEGKKAGMIEERFLRLDGSSFDAEVIGVPIEINDQSSMLVMFQDVTERKQASARLQESEQRYHFLVDLLPISVGIQKDNMITFLNPFGVSMFGGRTQDDMLGRSILDHIPPESRQNVRDNISQFLANGESSGQIEEKLVRLDGSVFDAEVIATPYNSSTGMSLLAVINDITGRKQAQDQLARQNQRIQEISRKLVRVQEDEKHLLAVELHDEIGQSLTSLKLNLELLGKARSASAREASLENSRSLLTSLMEKVREMSFNLRPAMLDDFGLLTALGGLFERFQAQTGIRIDCNYDLKSERRFESGVETAAYRIIQEALTNIARHAAVKAASVNLLVGDKLTIEISDHGAGFDPAQAVKQDTRTAGISGMQERARLLGGQLEIYSDWGTGTRIIANLPLVEGKA